MRQIYSALLTIMHHACLRRHVRWIVIARSVSPPQPTIFAQSAVVGSFVLSNVRTLEVLDVPTGMRPGEYQL